ncbi:MAG: acyl-CoA thioesterase [Chromatiales bacterium]|jgi:acyl-CoA thioesterase YciA
MSDVDARSGAVPVMRVPATPLFANDGGDIFGGWIMAQIDIAGSVPAVQRARGRVVTVAVNSLQFLRPVFVGDMVSLYAEVVQTGGTSLTVDIEVFADRNPTEPERVRVCEARLTYVAVDSGGQPRELPPEPA